VKTPRYLYSASPSSRATYSSHITKHFSPFSPGSPEVRTPFDHDTLLLPLPDLVIRKNIIVRGCGPLLVLLYDHVSDPNYFLQIVPRALTPWLNYSPDGRVPVFLLLVLERTCLHKLPGESSFLEERLVPWIEPMATINTISPLNPTSPLGIP